MSSTNNYGDVIRIESPVMLSLKHLEQIGIKLTEIQDIKHIYPSVTLIKFASKV